MIVRPALGYLPSSRSFRGQPLAIMLVVFALWIALRASFWSPPIGSSELIAPFGALGEKARKPGVSGPKKRPGPPLPQWWRVGPDRVVFAGKAFASTASVSAAPIRLAALASAASGGQASGLNASRHARVRSPLLVGELGPTALHRALTIPDAAPFSLPAGPVRASDARRLSIDGWLFLRDGGGGGGGGGGEAPFAPTYGKSQFGVVLRYELGPRSAHLPQAYLRATGAIDSREADLAAGISVLPVPAMPLRVHGEVRLSRLGDRTEVRPSAFVTAGIDEALPLGARVRGYAQAGYVGGEFATGFADGSLVVEREATRFERGAVALGIGAWGGAQQGTERLDAGPTASVDLRLGKGVVRMAADYRFRVAGNAEPSSGAALTLSTSF